MPAEEIAGAAMDMDKRWLNRSPQTMLETFHWFEGEGPHRRENEQRKPGNESPTCPATGSSHPARSARTK